MNTTVHTVSKLALVLTLATAAGNAQALDCAAAADRASALYAAKASKDQAAYASVKQAMEGASDEANIYPMLIRAVDEGLYSSPDAMHKAALRYCSRKLAAK